MIDTVNLRLTAAESEGVSFIDEIPRYLTDVGTHQYSSGEVLITGKLNGLTVTANRWEMKVKDGSLCKWYLGNNYKAMSRGDVQRAFERLSDELHQPMSLAAVTRLDVGCTLITQFPVAVYINHLGGLAWAQRLRQPDSVYYKKRDEVLCFYDKNKEQRATGEAVPDLYRDRNVIRYEQRFVHRLASVLRVPKVTAATLYDEGFYIAMLKRWRDTYNAIEKINDIHFNFKVMKGVKSMNRFGLLALVEIAGGEIAMIDQIDEARRRGELTKKEAHDMKQAVKRACRVQEGVSVQSEAVKELTKKITEAVRNYR